MRVLPPIPPVGMTMGPVGKEMDEEAGTEERLSSTLP